MLSEDMVRLLKNVQRGILSHREEVLRKAIAMFNGEELAVFLNNAEVWEELVSLPANHAEEMKEFPHRAEYDN